MTRLRIEIGNFYRDGLGRRIGPMYPLPVYLRYQRLVWGAENYAPLDEPHQWTDNGRYQLNKYRPKGDYDLHEEWPIMTPDPEDETDQNILELVHTYLCHINDGRPSTDPEQVKRFNAVFPTFHRRVLDGGTFTAPPMSAVQRKLYNREKAKG